MQGHNPQNHTVTKPKPHRQRATNSRALIVQGNMTQEHQIVNSRLPGLTIRIPKALENVWSPTLIPYPRTYRISVVLPSLLLVCFQHFIRVAQNLAPSRMCSLLSRTKARDITNRENKYVLFTPMETCVSTLLRMHRLTNDVYFVGTNYNDISVPVNGNLRFELPK